MNRYEAHISRDWKEHGLAQLLVARFREDESLGYGIFLVDTWCLGVKDAFGESGLPASTWDEIMETQLPEANREPIHPACAKKLIEGAIAYAERLGFAPHRDFRKARRVLSEIDSTVCPTEFTYGRDGRPCFARGPDDSEERVERVCAMLEAKVGPEGFDFVDEDEDEDEVAELRDALMDWLADEPEEVPRFYFLSGLITALHLSPEMAAPTKVFDVLWPEGRDWENAEELEDFTTLLISYWNYIGDLLQDASVEEGGVEPVSDLVDVWEDDLPEQKEGEPYDGLPLIAAYIEWADGFWRATEEWPELWGDVLTRADLAPQWELVRCWAGYLDEENRRVIDAAVEEPVPRTLGGALQALVRTLRRPALPDQEPE